MGNCRGCDNVEITNGKVFCVANVLKKVLVIDSDVETENFYYCFGLMFDEREEN